VAALLLVLAPTPLTPGASASLFAFDRPTDGMEAIFSTRAPLAGSRWRSIYIHHSATSSGNAYSLGQSAGSLGDHFVIGNGDGAIDGEIQVGHRWNQQTTAAPPAGAEWIDPTCISICLVGNFDAEIPTSLQVQRLAQLVSVLQTRFGIPAHQILLSNDGGTAAAIGAFFPTEALRQRIVR
jgi:hypothetical protein